MLKNFFGPSFLGLQKESHRSPAVLPPPGAVARLSLGGGEGGSLLRASSVASPFRGGRGLPPGRERSAGSSEARPLGRGPVLRALSRGARAPRLLLSSDECGLWPGTGLCPPAKRRFHGRQQRTKRFLSSLAKLWVASNLAAPSWSAVFPDLQQHILLFPLTIVKLFRSLQAW